MTHLVVFEDEHHAAFEIVAAVRGVFDLRCGARTLLERLAPARGTGSALVLSARAALADLVREAHPDAHTNLPDGDALFVNARLLTLGDDLERLVRGPAAGFGRFAGEALVTARCGGAAAAKLLALLTARIDAGERREPIAAAFARVCPDAVRSDAQDEWRAGSCLLEHAWDLVRHNGAALCDDFRRGPGAGIDAGALVYPGVHLLQDGAIRIAAGCRIKPGVVLDAEDGPITLAEGVDVQPHVVVRGPVYVGAHTILKAGARIQDGTSLGPVCKIGGEIAETVVQGYSNKQHDGFLGHAWIGEWVNLGAGTDNSDLKNNYSRVRMWEGGGMRDTGMQFLGVVAADHVKSAIGTQFNTGTVIGLSSQIFGSGFPPKFVPPFSWGGAGGLAVYDYRRAADTARAVMQRRGVTMSAAYERALRRVFDGRERLASADDS